MTEQTNADLIAELRGFAAGSESARASLMRDAADALEAADQRGEDISHLADAASGLTSRALQLEDQRDQLVAVIEQAEDYVTRHYLDTRFGDEVLPILATAPTDALREHDAKVRAEQAERDRAQLAAVVEKVRAWAERNKGTGYGTGTGASALEILDILDTDPDDVLREVRAAAWDEGADDIAEYIENGGERELPNPYRAREEQS